LGEAGKAGLGMGMGAGTIESVRTMVEQGRAPTVPELAVPVALPLVAGVGITGMGQLGQFLTGEAAKVAENVGKYARAGVRNPTPGQLNPSAYAGIETRIATREPGGEVSTAVQRGYRELGENLQGISKSGDYEPANVFQSLKARLETRNLEADLNKLNEKAKASQAAVDAAKERARATGLVGFSTGERSSDQDGANCRRYVCVESSRGPRPFG